MSGFLLDLNRCVGCGACVLACRIENALPEGVRWRRILTLNPRRAVAGPTYHFSLACHHCEDPPCARGCPSGALEKGPDGIVFLNEDLCLGCRYCEMACPFGAPSFDEGRGLMTKCHLCARRLDRGLLPACTQACPTGALRFTPEVPATTDPFEPPTRIPGFKDPARARPSLWMAPPQGGLRNPLFRALRVLAGPAEEDTRG
ncbi:MAG: 4Fe-4S dicluster domain-containing protein [Longimicrobiales bacterium]